MAGEDGSNSRDGGAKKQRTEAEKRRRTKQQRKQRARKADQHREQGQMLRQLSAAATNECRFYYATTHDSADCPDKEVIQARDKHKLDRRLQIRQAKEEKAAASVEKVHIHESIRAVFAAQLKEGSPLTSLTLAELYQGICHQKLSNTLSEDEEND
ncbi:hypothetical protein SLS63_013441 [Diaporthe eres]|uniref:BZIP domain-containing protein n=1 Tax=Diaporthe eres TaxID=83184 RepID=A0ABR1NNI4_DIAER